MPQYRLRRVCFTLNNYSELELANITAATGEAWCARAVVGRELSESGTPHLQGYFEANSAKSFTAWKTAISHRAHLEPARGSAWDNFVYCTKEDQSPVCKPADPDLWREAEPTGAAGVLSRIAQGTYQVGVCVRWAHGSVASARRPAVAGRSAPPFLLESGGPHIESG